MPGNQVHAGISVSSSMHLGVAGNCEFSNPWCVLLETKLRTLYEEKRSQRCGEEGQHGLSKVHENQGFLGHRWHRLGQDNSEPEDPEAGALTILAQD